MKKSILILVIYLSGVVISYNYGKHVIAREVKREWDKGDRLFCCAISTFSYLSVAAFGVVDIAKRIQFDLKEKASW